MYSPSQMIDDKFVVTAITDKTTKTGKPYQVLDLIGPAGQIEGKIWSEQLTSIKLKINTVAQLSGVIEEYQGKLSLSVAAGETRPHENITDHLPSHLAPPTVVFDIETVGFSFDQLSPDQQEYLLNKLEKDEPNKAVAKTKTGLHPLFAQVAFIALFNPASKQGVVLGLSEQKLKPKDATFVWQSCPDEKSLLTKFWELSKAYQNYVTFNGNQFDFPFLALRSAVHRVTIPYELKLQSDHFIDLQRKLRPFGTRPYSLAMITQALGITNPKAEGTTGLEVAELFRAGEHQKIVDYVCRDVKATTELYDIWKKHLAGKILL